MVFIVDIKNGVVFSIDGQFWSVIEFQYVKFGKGGVFVCIKFKNVVLGKVVDCIYNVGVKIEIENVDCCDYIYLYMDGDGYVFMDQSDFDQIMVGVVMVGDVKNFLFENQNVMIVLNNGNLLYIDFLVFVVFEIMYIEFGLQGDCLLVGIKFVMFEIGYEIQVLLFVEVGIKVKVDICMGDYLGCEK